MSDFETVVKLNQKDIEILGNVFVLYFLDHPSGEGVVSPQSALLQKILNAQTAQINEARAAGRL